jgi:hypothetical protein
MDMVTDRLSAMGVHPYCFHNLVCLYKIKLNMAALGVETNSYHNARFMNRISKNATPNSHWSFSYLPLRPEKKQDLRQVWPLKYMKALFRTT